MVSVIGFNISNQSMELVCRFNNIYGFGVWIRCMGSQNEFNGFLIALRFSNIYLVHGFSIWTQFLKSVYESSVYQYNITNLTEQSKKH